MAALGKWMVNYHYTKKLTYRIILANSYGTILLEPWQYRQLDHGFARSDLTDQGKKN